MKEEARRFGNVTAFFAPGETMSLIDVTCPFRADNEATLQTAIWVKGKNVKYRVPTLEAALANKYGAMLAPGRDAGKRAQEEDAMASFDRTFARRHAAAFQALHERLGFDFYSIDCAETHDGRLLVFEADAAAIIHLMDPPDMFPYKQPQMHRVFAAFDAMLHDRIN